MIWLSFGKLFLLISIYISLLSVIFHPVICDNNSDNNEDSAQTPIIKTCPFSGTRYPLGESWFRRLDTHDMSYCVACNCIQGGKSNCTSRPCDGLLKQCETAIYLSDLEKGCCQQCTDTKETKRVEIYVKTPRMEPIVTTRKPTIHKNSCLHNGNTYYDNQVFASNTSGIHRTQPNQCVQCICQSGLVLCRLKTCLADSCSSFVDEDGFNEDCCPLRANCRDKPISDSDDYHRRGGHLLTIYSPNDDSSATDQRFSANDCKSGGKVYANGDKWHPIIGPFGQMECVFCVCNSGSIECSRISCQSFDESSCLKLIRIPGQCCPSCADQFNVDNRIESSKQTKKTFIKSNDTNISNKNKDQNNETFCIPLKMDTIVFRSHAQSSNSGYYQYAFQMKATNRTTTLYSFTIKEGKIADFSEQHLTGIEFNGLSQTFKFKIMGATKNKFMDKFAKRTKKLPQRCTQMCKTRVERLERTLRIKEVLINTKCDKNSLQFY